MVMTKKLLSKKEFRAAAGISANELNTYIKRNRVIQNGNFIDVDNEVNRLFLEKRMNRTQARREELQSLDHLEKELINESGYNREQELALAKYNMPLPIFDKAIPIALVGNLNAGTIIYVLEAALTREIELRAQYNIPFDNVLSFYEKLTRTAVTSFNADLVSTINDIEEDNM